jgi:hypothetical protein
MIYEMDDVAENIARKAMSVARKAIVDSSFLFFFYLNCF